MKFMKLGSKPDAFQSDGKSIRYVSSELATDITIIVGEVRFYLHKFPLLSKSQRLQKSVPKASEENLDEINLADFPGGPKAFEICAKFFYGMTVTLNAYNVVAARCAAEYLEMTEDVDRGNLIFKIEVFLNSSIFRSWKDSIIVLQTTRSLLPWSEDLKIVGRCIDSIASKTSVDPANITWSYTYNRKLPVSDRIVEDGMKFLEKIESVPKDWWVEDICEVEIDLYKRVIIAVKLKGRMDGAVIGEALKTYAVRWLPDSVDALVSDDHSWRNRYLIETIVCLLPSDREVGCSCSFLLKLLKAAILVGASDSSREDLVKRISLKLHEASVKDLLIPAQSPQSTLYDVDLVQCMVNRFVMHEKHGQDFKVDEKNEETDSFVLGHRSLLNIGKLIDGYLAEIARDPNLTLASFIDLSHSIPDSARPTHDGLYVAIDTYLKENPRLTKTERKKICSLMDVKRLTMDASMHAAQNERLPLRVVVQVLFFEQVRAAAGVPSLTSNPGDASHSSTNTDEEYDKKVAADVCKSLNKQMSQLKVKDDDSGKNGKLTKKNSKNSKSGIQLLPSRSRRMFDKLWVVGKGRGESRSSETSASSQSPTSMAPGDTKSSGSSSRHGRHSNS
ncbi:Phototropic-responsive NPH3 family protein isoform 2 [Tripterygium wilfordii]|uniref:Phototropic-responsive NPH3 family protein isoform 2 n=1 Tax=Tripterygium wilfordii TaxID=458696 RepID=A0A7J7DAG3_TRIWF|nr:BTB/POZ domain-containing protein NPY1 [Tripterygium wilfordii]XP_038711437.1 BTB/POZ domain-containing protein NPY1 [Tripterygium wilfordii]XP_038711438.1 BTB/POZ domain-containing protein NPY1 [Tripterygium wilfordii]KAF5743365.1 Phototropic-responsive NPH3 family protein isoform 2 [Tripterygium wilfordii]